MRVQWRDIDSKTYEDMISALISTIYSDAQRIDGTSGDGGRDIQIRDGNSLHIFECKLFTGRLSRARPNRRSQVEESLKTAATLAPHTWSLVVPIDPNPQELEWFEGLQEKYAFSLRWLGLTWLDSQMAKFPAIPRYFLFDGDNEAMRALREINQERAALSAGVPDAIERLRTLRDRLDEVSPHYRLDIALEGESVRVSVFPKYRGAELDEPITVSGSFVFRKEPADEAMLKRLQQVFDYGGDIAVSDKNLSGFRLNAPAGLAHELSEGTLILSSHLVPEGLPLRFMLTLRDSDGRHLASLPGNFTERVVGRRGATLKGSDLTSAFSITSVIDTEDRSIRHTFNFSVPSGLLPGALLPVLRFATHLHSPNTMSVQLVEAQEDDVAVGEQDLPPEPLISPRALHLIEDLDFIQGKLGVFFPVPDELTQEDRIAIADASSLLRDGHVAARGDVLTMHLEPSADVRGLLAQEEPFQILQTGTSYNFTVAGRTLTIRPVRIHCSSVKILNRQQIESAQDPQSLTFVRFDVGGGPRSIILEPATGVQEDAPRPVVSRRPDPQAEWWTTSDIAEYLGVRVGTISSYRKRGQMPLPDKTVGRTHLWRPTRIIEWNQSRT